MIRARAVWGMLFVLVACKASPTNDPSAAGNASAGPSATTASATSALTAKAVAPSARGLVAFPGAQGFGAHATGGRGGSVCVVTTNAKAGAGSLASCLARSEPRTVVFRVGGVFEGPFELAHGNLTLAGQTAPGGVTIKGGLVCDNVYDKNDCTNLVLRHLRLRGGEPDSLRLGGTHDIMVDHVSLSGAEDENLELTRSHDVTVQYSVVAEPRGDHFKYGGVLINYSKDGMPLGSLSLHHNVWNGVAGRLPELSCEENDDGPGKSNCSGRALIVDLVDNVLWDTIDPIWFNRCTGTNQGNDCPVGAANVTLDMNLVGNVLARRSSGDGEAPLLEPHAFEGASRIAARDNKMLFGARATAFDKSTASPPHAHGITVTPASEVVALLRKRAGAFPRDVMDKRLAAYLDAPIDARPAAWKNDKGIDVGDAFAGARDAAANAAPADGDNDGMPDAWETQHGFDPKRADANVPGGAACGGYAALECYLNELADARIAP